MRPHPPCILTIDVEDWFHILDVPATPPLATWDSLPPRVEHGFLTLLDIVGDRRATCFFLGWIAERYPRLVREAHARGHEIASHGFSHRLAYEMSRAAFRQDALRARQTLEDLSGTSVLGYRSAGFSIRADTDWAFDELIEAGYRYDSSMFPALRGHGGYQGGQFTPHYIERSRGRLAELPITVTPVLGRPMCFFGGGYLRLFPYWMVRHMARRVLARESPVVFYVHPREVDPEHPRLPMNAARRFRTYVNLDTTAAKLRRIIADFPLVTAREYLEANLEGFTPHSGERLSA